VTDGAAGEIDSGEAAEGIEGGFVLRRRPRRRSHREQGPAVRESLGAMAIREQSEVSDAREARGQDMEQEAAEELGRGEVHRLHAVTVGVVAPAESDDAVVQGEEAVVAEGDAVGVAAEVGEHLRGAAEGGLGVDDPGRAAQSAQEIADVEIGGQSLTRDGVLERREDLAAKDLRERAHGKQEALAGRDPAGAVGGQGAAGHHAVQVDVLAEILSPGVEDGRDA